MDPQLGHRCLVLGEADLGPQVGEILYPLGVCGIPTETPPDLIMAETLGTKLEDSALNRAMTFAAFLRLGPGDVGPAQNSLDKIDALFEPSGDLGMVDALPVECQHSSLDRA